MIFPTKADLGKRVFHRAYQKSADGIVGQWLEGRIDAIGKMLIMVEFKEGMLDLNRSDLEWAIP